MKSNERFRDEQEQRTHERDERYLRELKEVPFTGFPDIDQSFLDSLDRIKGAKSPTKPDDVAQRFARQLFPYNIRYQTAHDFFAFNPPGNYFMSKTTRVGCITNLIAAAKDLGLKVLAIEPTNSISETTIMADVPQFCKEIPIFTQLVANQYCWYNQLLVAGHKHDKHLYKTLTKIPIMSMKKDCRDCRDFECSEVENPPEACLKCYDTGACVGCGRLYFRGKEGCKNCSKIHLYSVKEFFAKF